MVVIETICVRAPFFGTGITRHTTRATGVKLTMMSNHHTALAGATIKAA